MQRFTADHPWLLADNRRNRRYNTVTPGSLNAKCEASLPPALVRGRSVLDLGACVGHAGWWALRNGARFYCGVEAQPAYAQTALRLFAAHFAPGEYEIVQDDLIAYLKRDARRFDIVLLAGVTYGFVDPLYLLRLCAERAQTIVVDTWYPRTMRHPDDTYLEFIPAQLMVLARDDVKHASGAGSRISPRGLDVVMANLGFDAEPVEVPPIDDCDDVYNRPRPDSPASRFPPRYIRRYVRGAERLLSVSEEVGRGEVSDIVDMYDPDKEPA